MSFLKSISGGTSRDNERLSAELKASQDILRLYSRISTILSSSFARDTLISQLLLLFEERFPNLKIMLAFYDPAGGLELFADAYENPDRIPSAPHIPSDGELSLLTVPSEGETGKWSSILGDSAGAHPRVLNLPLINNEEYAGSLFALANAAIEPSTRRLLGDLAVQVSAAIQNIRSYREKDFIISSFGKIVDPRIRDHLLAGKIQLGGELRDVSIMFVDIRDFTGYSERHNPREVVEFLNGFFKEMEQCVKRHEGLINKFTGDGFLAIFGAPLENVNHAQNALAAAVDMVRIQGSRKDMSFGIGIESGTVLAGMVGSGNRMEYTVIGDAVNAASRLEGLSKYYGAAVLVSRDFFERARGSDFLGRSLGPVRVKGRKAPMGMIEILGGKDFSIDPEKISYADEFGEAVDMYFRKDFAAARECLAKLAALYPADMAVARYLANVESFLRDESGKSWDGIETFLIK